MRWANARICLISLQSDRSAGWGGRLLKMGRPRPMDFGRTVATHERISALRALPRKSQTRAGNLSFLWAVELIFSR
jgi:hypothetical protein